MLADRITTGFGSGPNIINFSTAASRKRYKQNDMWSTESLWFEIAIVSIIFAVGNMVMGQFEEQTPKIRRVGKYLLMLLIVCGISVAFGRPASMIVLVVFFLPVLYVHLYYLPKKKGINGWTGEPKRKYYDFRKWNKDVFSK